MSAPPLAMANVPPAAEARPVLPTLPMSSERHPAGSGAANATLTLSNVAVAAVDGLWLDTTSPTSIVSGSCTVT